MNATTSGPGTASGRDATPTLAGRDLRRVFGHGDTAVAGEGAAAAEHTDDHSHDTTVDPVTGVPAKRIKWVGRSGFPLEQTAAAHDAVENNIVGKVLIDVA